MKKDDDWIPEFNSIFKDELRDLLIYKRSNGYKYGKTKVYKLLALDKFFIKINLKKKYITQDIVDLWLQECPSNNAKTTKAKYFSYMSIFCNYLITTKHKNIIQPEPHNIKYHSEFIPYIFSNEEICKISKYIKKLIEKNQNNMNYKTFYVMFCLFYCCGLRFSEAHMLKLNNFDAKEQKLIIENSKNNITREIPLSNSLFTLLNNYITMNSYPYDNSYIFINNKNDHIYQGVVRYIFKKVLKGSKISLRYDGKSQRIHDLRHTFAVNSLKQMEQKGFDLYTSLSQLSVYLGHKSIRESEYYLRAVQDETKECQEQMKNYTKGLYESKVIYNE